jgi:hypothetical protein
LRKQSLVIASGKMALIWVAWGAGVVVSLYTFIWLAIAGYVLWGVAIFFAWFILSAVIAHRKFSHIFDKSRGLGKGKSEDWILLFTVLAAGFATGAAFQNVSTIGSETISRSSCISPSTVNVTSPNCAQVQTITLAQGPFLYLGQLGVWIVTLAALGALVFGMIYTLLRLLPPLES